MKPIESNDNEDYGIKWSISMKINRFSFKKINKVILKIKVKY
jgi:hypothetical protein